MDIFRFELMIKVVLCMWFVFITSANSFSDNQYTPSEGDLIFQSLPHGDLVDAIEGASNSVYSHVGIVMSTKNGWFVREALGNVHDVELSVFVNRGRNKSIGVFRLKPGFKEHIPQFLNATNKYLERPYDIRYRMDDEYIYCSELVYKAFNDATGIKMGKLVELGSLNWGKHEQLIVSLEGGVVPKDRQMITPVALSKANQLQLIYSSY